MPTSSLATYRIGAAARLTGLSEHLLRVWERRYRAVQPRRAESGARLYSEADLARLRLLKRATERGHAIGSIAALDAKQLQRLAGEPAPPAADGPTSEAATHALVEAFLRAIAALDLASAEEAVSRADVSLGSRRTALEVLIPVLRKVGQKWEEGELSVAQEHAAAAVVRNYLGSAVRSLGRDEHAPVAVATTPPGELHEFGALVASLYAASHGLRVAYLGPNLPTADLVQAVRTMRARVVLLSAVARSRGLETDLAELRAALPSRVQVVVGGAAAQRLRRVPAGIVRLQRVEELGPLLASAGQSIR